MRSAIAQRDAETLRDAERDVGAEFTRRPQQRQAQQVGRHGDSAPAAWAFAHEAE